MAVRGNAFVALALVGTMASAFVPSSVTVVSRQGNMYSFRVLVEYTTHSACSVLQRDYTL